MIEMKETIGKQKVGTLIKIGILTFPIILLMSGMLNIFLNRITAQNIILVVIGFLYSLLALYGIKHMETDDITVSEYAENKKEETKQIVRDKIEMVKVLVHLPELIVYGCKDKKEAQAYLTILKIIIIIIGIPIFIFAGTVGIVDLCFIFRGYTFSNIIFALIIGFLVTVDILFINSYKNAKKGNVDYVKRWEESETINKEEEE